MFLQTLIVAFAISISCSNVNSQSDEQLLASLGKIYGSSAASNGKYFSTNGKTMFEQVSMLDSIALAKLEAISEARDQLKFLAVQTLLADLPPKYQAAGDLLALIESDRSFFSQTIDKGENYLESVSQDIRQKVSQFESSQQTDQDRERVRGEIENLVKEKTSERNELTDAWIADFNRLKELAESNSPTPQKRKAWHVYGTVKALVKRLKFDTRPGKLIGPVSDVLGIVISGFGLADAIENSNTKGIVKSVVGIVGGLVGLAAFGLAMPGFGAIAGVAFFIIPMIIEAIWPSNLAIETANKLSEISREDMEGHLTQLIKFSASGKKSFGWMYIANTGVMIKKGISPDTQMKFFHPSCENPGATPCNPKKRSYEGKNYFMLGEQRSSTDSRPEFALEMPFDFIGAPTEENFCGNTININTTPFRQYLEFLVRKYSNIGRNIGYYHRNIEIDTQVVPNYNDVSFGEWERSKRSILHSKVKRKLKKLRQKVEDQQTECEPESDRISIDELDHIDPRTGRITINTGAGKDVLSLNSMIGDVGSSKEDFIVSDLGDDGNLLSLGVALGIGRHRGNLLVGVIFENTGGNGKICYLKEDFVTRRCVGHVKKVTVFKGSRMHDTVVMGADGPYVVIQNFGANEYVINVDDVKRKQGSVGEMRFEIMDLSGNRPIIKIKSSTRTPWYRHPEDGYFMVRPDGIDIRIDITGIVTEPDLYLVPSDGNEQCVYPEQF